jgi:hypothetical protein
VVGAIVAVGVGEEVGLWVGLEVGVGLWVGLEAGLAVGEGDDDKAAGVGLAELADWVGATFVWCGDGVDRPSELGDEHMAAAAGVPLHAVPVGLAPGPPEVGVFTSSTEVPLGALLDLFSRWPLR